MASPKTCFIAMPVSTSEDDAVRFDDPDHWSHVLHTVFVPAVERAGFTAIPPTMAGSDLIHSRIVQHLQTADMVLCDLSSHNPNVFFELGVRTATNKPIALIRDDHTSLPFDTGGINTEQYASELRGWQIPGEVEKVAKHLRESEQSCDGKNPLWQAFGLSITASEPEVGESPDEARWELAQREMHSLRADIASLRDAMPGTAVGVDLNRATLRPLNENSKAPEALKAFYKDASTFLPDDGTVLRWMWQSADPSSVYVPAPDLDKLHLASRRAVEAQAAARNLRVSVIPF